MVAFGFGEVIGGLFLGFFIDRFGSKKASIVNVLIILILISVTLVCVY
jgi:MFS family permease